MEKKRLAFIDYGKALAILFVLTAHLELEIFLQLVLFTMPMFFITSGYTFSIKNTSLGEFARSKFKRLILPFWYVMLLDIPFEIARAYFFKYGSYKVALPALLNTIYGSAGKLPNVLGLGKLMTICIPYRIQLPFTVDIILPANCHLWFLPAMFTASILFFVLIKHFRNKNFALVTFSLLFLLIAGIESLDGVPQLPYGLGRGFVGAVFMLFGYKLKETSFFEKSSNWTKIIVLIATSVLSLIFIFGLNIRGGGMIKSNYGPYGLWSTYMTFVAGACATIAVLILCKILEKFRIGVVEQVLSAIGQNTMTLYLWQFFFFSVMEGLYIKIPGKKAAPDIFFMEMIPHEDMWYNIIELVVFVATILLIERMRKQRSFSKGLEEKL